MVEITGLASPAAVIDSVKRGESDIGLIAFDPARAGNVAFCGAYMLAQNTYILRYDAPFRFTAQVDRPRVKVGVTARDTADLYLARALKAAEIRRNDTGSLDPAVAWQARQEGQKSLGEVPPEGGQPAQEPRSPDDGEAHRRAQPDRYRGPVD